MKKIFTLLILMASYGSMAQSIPLDKPLKLDLKPKLTGGINASTAYNSSFPDNRLNFFLSGNLNLGIGQFSLPVSFNLSDRKFQFSQAYTFNQVSINPTYKWASAQIGITNSNFSQYSLNGHQYTGVGLNLRPGKWNVQLMGGRLLKATATDTVIGPTFNRWGYGAKTSVQVSDQLSVGGSVFYAADQENSLAPDEQIFNNQPINPSNNLVLSFDFSVRPTDFLEWRFEVHNSLLNPANADTAASFEINSPAAWIMQPTAGTQSFTALKTSVNFKLPISQTLIGLGYEQVDPDYRTLGGYFFVNDIRNYTVNFSTSLLEQKWNINSSIGVQEDDINNTKSSSQRRFVGSINSSLNIAEGLNINSSYSNMQAFMFVRDVYQEITQVPGQPIDSLDYSQISQNFNTTINKKFAGSESLNSNLSLNFSFAKAEGRNGPILRDETKSDILNINLRYMLRFPRTKFDIGPAITFNQNKFSTGLTQGVGPSLQLNKSLLDDKARIGVSTSYLLSERSEQRINAFNTFINASYQPIPKHNIRLNAGIVSSSLGRNYQNINLGYGFNF